jgi:uncharacterized protein YjbI with pentapeptide repeats
MGADGLRLGRESTEINDCQLDFVTLARARMSGAQLRRTSFFESKLNGADLEEANFANVDLSGANLTGPRNGQNTFSIRKYYGTNKHGLNHGCYNAKLHTT